MGLLIDMTGQKHGRLTVVSRAPNIETRAAWNCLCECGNEVVVDGKKLRTKHTQSCGCYRAEVTCPAQGKANTKHGRSRTAEYRTYYGRLRETALAQQKPQWADMDKIRDIYLNRPNDCHVDHIVPLRGKNVSGLHVENNLQYLPIRENMRKHNNYFGADSWHTR